MHLLVTVYGVAALILVSGCVSGAETASSATSTSALSTPDVATSVTGIPEPVVTSEPQTPTTASFDPSSGSEICSVTDGSGRYYLNVTSQAEHDFRVCEGGAPYGGSLDDLFQLPHMDRRCIVASNDALARNHGLVGVYSDTTAADLAAARAYCTAQGGAND
jgi:hypothetical protein